MKKVQIICDSCGKEPTKKLSLVIGRKTDAAGSADDVQENFDLCHNCLAVLLAAFLRRLGGVVENPEKLLADIIHAKVNQDGPKQG